MSGNPHPHDALRRAAPGPSAQGVHGRLALGDPRDDTALMHAHAGGDPHAFAELVRRHRDRLWAVAQRTLADREDAADALQDALLSAYRAAAGFRGESAVTTWLHRIVVNACLDRARRRQARPTVPLPEIDSTAAPAIDRETPIVVRAALAQLPAEQRAALVLVDLNGYPVAEVAVILGVAEGTVKSRCSRGRARLAILLGHLRETPGRGDGAWGSSSETDRNLSAGRDVSSQPAGTGPTGTPRAGKEGGR